MNSPADIWAKVLSLMENEMTATTINTWFDDARAVSLDADKFVLHGNKLVQQPSNAFPITLMKGFLQRYFAE